jgi:NADPH:quinone reductase
MNQPVATMAVIKRFGDYNDIELMEQPLRKLRRHEVLIKVAAVSLNPIDLATIQGYAIGGNIYPHLQPSFPYPLGWDAAGTISAVGKGVRQWQVGDKVIALLHNLAMQQGAQATQLILPAELLASWPSNITAAQASCLPLTGMTAYQAIDALRLKSKETLLINGPLGSVGSIAVQLAVLKGVRVVGVVRASEHEQAVSLGIRHFIERDSDITEAIKKQNLPIDAALDVVGGAVAVQTIACVRDNGRYVTLIPQLEIGLPTPQRGIVQQNILIVPDATQLQTLSTLVSNSKVKIEAPYEMSFSNIRKAYSQSMSRTIKGKIALIM